MCFQEQCNQVLASIDKAFCPQPGLMKIKSWFFLYSVFIVLVMVGLDCQLKIYLGHQ